MHVDCDIFHHYTVTGSAAIHCERCELPYLKETENAVQQAAHSIMVLNSLASLDHNALSWCKMTGVISKRALAVLSLALIWRIPLSTNANFGMGIALGSGKSVEIYKYLTAAK